MKKFNNFDMKISELENPPHWLKIASTLDEDVEIINGLVIWKGGIWECGIWECGIWEDGVWECGIWEDGVWEGGVWKDGFWKDGVWEGEVWKGGIWEGGVWKGGVWEGGVWKGGVWEGGITSIKSKYIPLIDGNIIKIGCKDKTIEEWDKWFAGTENFETKRNTIEFKMIYAHYCAIKEYIRILNS